MSPVEQIHQIAKVVREVLEDLHETYTDDDGAPRSKIRDMVYWESDLGGACGLASVVLRRSLRRRGVDAEVVAGDFDGEPHYWVEVTGQVVDITVTQFDGRLPAVYVTDRDTRYVPDLKGYTALTAVHEPRLVAIVHKRVERRLQKAA